MQASNAGSCGNADDATPAATSVGPSGTDHRETADDYRGELFRFGRYRVAVCRDGIQWLYQRQRPGLPAVGAAWDTLSYCTTRAALFRLHREHTGAEAGEVAALAERVGAAAS